jgi:signal transduction histidine kinase
MSSKERHESDNPPGDRKQVPERQFRWRIVSDTVPAVYRALAFVIASIQTYLFPAEHYSLVPPVILTMVLGAYSILVILRRSQFGKNGSTIYGLIAVDLALSIFLVITTGGFYSPYLLYTLVPVLTSAMFLDRKITVVVAAVSSLYIILCHLLNPFIIAGMTLAEISYFFIYVVAIALAAAMPYIINVNLRQRYQSEDILRERQRLSQEIHDGTVQTLTSLHWQVQLTQRPLADMGVELDEMTKLELLAERAIQETRQSLEFLRDQTGDIKLVPYLRSYLADLGSDGKFTCNLTAEGELSLEIPVQLQLLRICQEALVNIRKHSEAGHVDVRVTSSPRSLRVIISDDGRGFDTLVRTDGAKAEGIGLDVMRERAESIGGSLNLISMPGQGTKIEVEVPVKQPEGGWIWSKK